MSAGSDHVAKLSKAPLQEVIFEAFWELSVNPQTKQPHDPGFELAQGVFAENVSERFPYHKRMPHLIVPPFLMNPQPVHQFWHGEGEWPVLQLGPGLFAANETEKNYVWDSEFLPVIRYGLEAVVRSYKTPPPFNRVSLRYIDAVELEGEFKDDFIMFIETNLQIRVDRGFEMDGTISNQMVNQTHKLEDGSVLNLMVSDGQRNAKPAVVWQTVVMKEGRFSVDDIREWVPNAHSVCSGLFRKMLRKGYYDSLK